MMVEKQPDTIVHLGAGRCSEFREYDASGARRIILVEANPEVARYLRETYRHDERVEIVERAVSDSTGRGQLRIFNVKEYSSLRDPTGLCELYPGLREVDRVSVEVVSLGDLVGELEIQRDRFNWLIVDAPGEEAAVSRAVCTDGLADVFDRVTLCAFWVAGFGGTEPLSEVVTMLEECAYEVHAQDGIDSDRPVATLYRDRARVENTELHKRIEAAEKLAAERAKEVMRLTRERDELSATARRVQQELDSVQKDCERRAGEHAHIETQTHQAEKRIAELEERLAAAAKENEAHAAKAKQLVSQVERFVVERDEMTQRVPVLEDQLITTEQERDRYQHELESEKARNTLLSREMARVEAQLELVKELSLGKRSP